MSEIAKTVGQLIVSNVGLAVIIGLYIISGLFKITKFEIDPLGTLIRWVGSTLTKDVRKDVADLKTDYNDQISNLKADLDSFEKRTNSNIDEMKNGTSGSCEMLKKRLDMMERSNDMQTVRQIKEHVFDFANSCFNKRKHTKQDFENIIHENEEYERLVKKYKLVNDVYDEDFGFIMKIYHKCQDEGSFLSERDADA